MTLEPLDPNSPDVVSLTVILQELTPMFSTGGFQSELRDPYKEYGTETPGRDLKITHIEAPAYYAAVKATAQPEGPRLVVQSATFFPPGFIRLVLPPGEDLSVAYREVLQFVVNTYSDFRRDELSERRS